MSTRTNRRGRKEYWKTRSYQHVIAFQVPVRNALSMEESHGLCNLDRSVQSGEPRETLSTILQQLPESSTIDIFRHNVNLRVIQADSEEKADVGMPYLPVTVTQKETQFRTSELVS